MISLVKSSWAIANRVVRYLVDEADSVFWTSSGG
jgi:hypothetical protein